MARADWEKEIDEAKRQEAWSLSGPNRIVKVVPQHFDPMSEASGYITMAKYLKNKTPAEVGKMLGVKTDSLNDGMRVYNLLRKPLSHEATYELTTKYPDGLVYNHAYSNPDYLPGADHVHQWTIKEGVKIPVDLGSVIVVASGGRFPG